MTVSGSSETTSSQQGKVSIFSASSFTVLIMKNKGGKSHFVSQLVTSHIISLCVVYVCACVRCVVCVAGPCALWFTAVDSHALASLGAFQVLVDVEVDS